MRTGRGAARRTTPLIGVILLAQWLVGCGPAPESLLAVERTESGGTRLLVAPCPAYNIHDVSVLRDIEVDPLELWSVVRDGPNGSPSQIDLFTAPSGYSVDDARLTSLQGPEAYSAEVRGTVGTHNLRGEVRFTVEQLGKLGAGKVLTGTKGDKVMDRAKFLKASSDRCEP